MNTGDIILHWQPWVEKDLLTLTEPVFVLVDGSQATDHISEAAPSLMSMLYKRFCFTTIF